MADYLAGPTGSAYVSLYVFDNDSDLLSDAAVRLMVKDGAPIAEADRQPNWLSLRTVQHEEIGTGGLEQTRLHLEMSADLTAAGPQARGTYQAELDVRDKVGLTTHPFTFEIAHEAVLLALFEGGAGTFAGGTPAIAPDPGTGPAAWTGDLAAYELDGNGALAPAPGHSGPSRLLIDSTLADLTALATVTFSSRAGRFSLFARGADDGTTFTALRLFVDPLDQIASVQEYSDDGTTVQINELVVEADVPYETGEAFEVGLTCSGDTITVRYNGQSTITTTSTHGTGGTLVGFESTGDAHAITRFAAGA